jgi:beta-glucosidase
MITSTWDWAAKGIVVSWLPGVQNGRGIAMALFNAGYEASGRLPFTFPKCNTPACTIDDEHASVALGDKIASGKHWILDDKALIGYRWYHAMNRTVSFPFGFGLFNYGNSQIAYSKIQASVSYSYVHISCRLSHSGKQAAHDVPQLYISLPDGVPGDFNSKPEWVLKGFKKVLVTPGVTETVHFTLTKQDLSYWNDGPGQSQWVCPPGKFRVCVGANARDAIRPDLGSCTTFDMTCE